MSFSSFQSYSLWFNREQLSCSRNFDGALDLQSAPCCSAWLIQVAIFEKIRASLSLEAIRGPAPLRDHRHQTNLAILPARIPRDHLLAQEYSKFLAHLVSRVLLSEERSRARTYC